MSLKSLQLPPLVFAGEETLQHWQPISLGRCADVSYAITHGPNKGKEETDWPRGLFACFSAPTVDVNCCCANSCCCTQYYLWSEAYELIGLGDEANQVAGMRIFAAAIPDHGGGRKGGGGGAGGLSAATNAVAAFRAGQLRGKLSRKLYGRDADGGDFGAAFAQCCCVQCANVQEIDAILTSVRHRTGVRLRYGPFCTRQCCNFVDATTGKNVTYYDLSQGVRGPQGQVMQRGAAQWAPTNLMGLPQNAITQQRGRQDFEKMMDQLNRQQQQ